MSCDSSEYVDDTVDPRVQVELERLNVATDEINRLEVDLDICRNQFRQLLAESTSRIEASAKKLGHSIEKARPYYDARLKAKEALRKTQQVAAKFERANSGHAAAKEMVFLAEEGLRTEGRTFDHAWQEMLNHATMRVNESEAERIACEAEHKRTSQIYQLAEMRVQVLQRELKRAITKSRPYFELKIHYNQLLEEQKQKVKSLEKQVTETKLCYAETLRNLEQISDEIHQIRQYNKAKRQTNKTGTESNDKETIGNKNEATNPKCSELDTDPRRETHDICLDEPVAVVTLNKMTPTSCSSAADTDDWSETTDAGVSEGVAERDSVMSENDSSMTGFPDSESEEDVWRANSSSRASQMSSLSAQFNGFKLETIEKEKVTDHLYVESVGVCSFPVESELNFDFTGSNSGTETKEWTEIQLRSPEDNPFRTIRKNNVRNNEDFDIPYAPLSEVEGELTQGINSHGESPKTPSNPSETETVKTNTSNNEQSLTAWLSARNGKRDEDVKQLPATPRKTAGMRRQSLDVIWSSATSEKMKEMLSNSILKFNIGSINERRSSEVVKPSEDNNEEIQDADDQKTSTASYETNLSNQFGLQFFAKKPKAVDDIKVDEGNASDSQESLSNQLGSFITRKDKFFARKVPNPLERTLSFLNTDEESASDSESLPSMDMLTDEQLSALVLDQDLAELYQDILQ